MTDMYIQYEKQITRDKRKKNEEEIELENKDLEESLNELEAIKDQLTDYQYATQLVDIYYRNDRDRLAYEAYKNIEHTPEFAKLDDKGKLQCYDLLSTIAYSAGESTVALEVANKGIEIGKKYSKGYIERIYYLNMLQLARTILEGHRLGVYHANLLKAIEYANIMVKQNFHKEDNYISLAKNYYKLNKYEEMYDASTHINNEGERTYYKILYLSLKGKTKESIKLANEFLSRCEDDRIITILLSYISNHIRLGRIDDAYHMYYSLLPYEPNLKNRHIENFFESYYMNGQYTYGQKQQEDYIFDKAMFHILHRSGEEQGCTLLDTRDKVISQMTYARDKIGSMKPYLDNLSDKYIYTEPELGDQYPTQDMIVLTNPGSKDIINMYPLGYGKSKKVKRRRY